MTKAEIRTDVAARKKVFSTAEFAAKSSETVSCIRAFSLYGKAESVGAYLPLDDETDISPLFRDPGKKFYVPALDGASGLYRMAKLTDERTPGRFGIPEPIRPVFAGECELDLILVPGIAFDDSGRRIGRGKGIYDRMLPLYSAVRIGIGFDFQRFEALPAVQHDCRMDYVVFGSDITEGCNER